MAKSAFAFPVGRGVTKTSAVRRRAESTIGLEGAAKPRAVARVLGNAVESPVERWTCARAGKLTFASIRSYADVRGGPPALGEERDRMESATG
jgi:hypothetical protein